MDHSELGEPYNGFRFKFIEPVEYDQVLQLMQDYLYTAAVPIGYDGFPEDWNNFFRAMMENGTNLSYIAVHIDSGEIAACRMSDLIIKDKPHEMSSVQHKRNADIFAMCEDVCTDENLFEKYGITEYVDMFGLCTHPKYRQMGLATEMYRRGLDFLKRRGYEIIKCGFISPWTRRAGYKFGYEEFARRKFVECRDEQGNILNPEADPDDYICFGVFNLRNRK